MHFKRWVSGTLLAVVLVVPLFLTAKWPFYMVIAILSIMAMVEIFHIFEHAPSFFLQLSAYLFSSCLFVAIYFGRVQYWPLIIAAWTLIPMILGVFFYGQNRDNLTTSIIQSIYVPCYIALPMALLTLIFRYPKGNLWVFFLFVAVFAGDTGAFYFGRLFGHHKLMPSISPGKTWEGAIGGAFCTIIAGLWFLRLSGLEVISFATVALLAAMSIMAQLGDLGESVIKRAHGKKDSGSLLPGHGGILDRIDGLLFAIPLVYYYLIRQ